MEIARRKLCEKMVAESFISLQDEFAASIGDRAAAFDDLIQVREQAAIMLPRQSNGSDVDVQR